MAKKTQGTIDLTLGVNAELEALSVKSAKFSKDIKKQAEKLGPIEVDAPVKLSKRTINRLGSLAEELKKGVQDSFKKSHSDVDFNIGLTKSIQNELKQSANLISDGKVVKSSLVKFLRDTSKLTATEAKRMVDSGGLLEPLLGKNKSQASAFLTERLKNLKTDKDKLTAAYGKIAQAIKLGESQLLTMTTVKTGGMQETTAHIKALAEAMDLITNPRKSKMSKGIATDIDLLNQRVITLKKGLTSIADLSAKAINDPEGALAAGYDPAALAKKADDLTRALKQERAELKRLTKDQRAAENSSERLAAARDNLKQSRLARQGYKGDDEQTRLRLLKEEYSAALALDRLRGKASSRRTDVLQRAIEAQISSTRELTQAEKKQADILSDLKTKVKAYDAAVEGLKNPDLSITQWKELTAVIDDYGRGIKRAKSLQAKDGMVNTELNAMVTGYTKLGAGVREAAEWQAKWNKAVGDYNFAMEPKAKLKAAQDMSASVQGKANALRYNGLGSKADLADLTLRSEGVQQLIQRQKELVIANNQAASSYNSLNGVMRSFFRYAVEFSFLYKIQQGVIDMVTSVVQLEDALKATQAISRSTDAEMQNVSASVEQVAIDTEYSTNEIAAAAQTLAQAGVDIREVGDALEYVAMAASATNSSIATTTDIMTTMMNVFKDMSFQEIADQMTATINLSKLTGDELSTILSRAVEVSDTFNIVPEQMNAAFAVLRNSGIKASTISTGYRQALLEVFSPDEKTLRFLEKRYAELGQNMSQGTIAAMFQGFARSEDPIRAVTEELEKLGYSTSAAAEFARVFDVRATNVLDVLVKQRDEYIKLTTQIDNHGAALKGNQTQMESLSKSFENLGSIVTVVANDAFGGMLGTLEKIVDNIGTIIQNGGKAMNILRESTGSSGIGAALGAGVLGGISRYTKTGSIASALGRGTGIAAVTETLQVALGSMGNKLTDTISELVGAVGVAVTAAGLLPNSLFKGRGKSKPVSKNQQTKFDPKGFGDQMAGKGQGPLAAVEEIASDPKTGLAATLASNLMEMVSIAVGWIKHLPKAFMAIGPAGWIATAGAALYTAMQMLDRDISVQIDAIRSRVEEANKNVKKLQDESAGNQKDVQQVQELTTSVDESQKALGDFFRAGSEGLDKTNEQIVDATNALDGVSFDLGSSGLAEGLKRLQERLGVLFSPTMDQRDIINQINKTKAEVDKVEGNRAAWQQQLLEAYEADAADRTKQQQALIKTFESFSAAEKASIGGRIRDLNQAKKYLDLAGRLSQAKDTGLQTALSAEQGTVEKGNRDIAKLEVQKSIKETGGLGGLTKLILQASKDGNAQLISDLRSEVAALRPDRNSAILATAGTLSNPSAALSDPKGQAEALQLLDEVQANAARESAQNMADHIAELEKQTAAQVDAFRNALTPDQAKSLGLPQSAIQEAEKATAKFLEGVPDEWKSAYNNAIGMNRTTSQSLEYLDKTKEKLGDFPPAIQKEYETLQKRAKVQEGYLASANQAAKDLAELGQKGVELQQQQSAVAEEISRLNPAAEKGDVVAISRKEVLSKQQVDLQKQFDQFEKDYAIKSAEFKNKTAAAGTPILDKEQTLAGIERTYKAQDNLNKASESKRLLLEEERNRLADLDNQDRIKNLDLNTKIYNLRVGEAKRIEETARDSLMNSTELSKAMGHTAKSYQEISDWFNSPEGQDFLEQHPNEALHLAKLTEAVKDQELARRELTQRLIDEAQAVDQRLARDTQVVELKSQVESRTVDQQAGTDQAKTSAEETRIVLDGLKARQALELKASDEKIGLLQEQAKAGRVTQLELTKATQQELDKQLQSRKDYLSQALTEEKKHIDNIRNLRQSLKDNADSERDFANQFNRQAAINQGMSQADALQFDRNIAGQRYNMARRELLFGDKVNGLKDMNDAISQQQRVVTDLQRAEAEGVVSWTDTAAAYQDLLVMYEARKKATEEQIAKEEAAKKAAADAADAQLKAINALVEALNRLAERLATMPTLDLGVTGEQTAPSDVTKVKPNPNLVTADNLQYETTLDSKGQPTYSQKNPVQSSYQYETTLDPKGQPTYSQKDAPKVPATYKVTDKSGQIIYTDGGGMSEEALRSKYVTVQKFAEGGLVSPQRFREGGLAGKKGTRQRDMQTVTAPTHARTEERIVQDSSGKWMRIQTSETTAQLRQKYAAVMETPMEAAIRYFQGHAQGGPIKGPGTGTSDSIPAMLSNGEYVIPADAVKKVGLPLLESIRKGMPDVNKKVGDILPAAALSSKAAPVSPKQEPTQTAIFQLGDAMIQTKANPSAVQEFQSALKVQSIKKGRRV